MLAPALIEVGVRWEAGDVTVAQEHLATSTVRAAMQRLLADARADVRGVAVLACAPGEQHEIGLLMFAVLLRADGWQVAYLGADTPVPEAVELARVIGASALCFSAGTSEGVAGTRGGAGTGARRARRSCSAGAAPTPTTPRRSSARSAGWRREPRPVGARRRRRGGCVGSGRAARSPCAAERLLRRRDARQAGDALTGVAGRGPCGARDKRRAVRARVRARPRAHRHGSPAALPSASRSPRTSRSSRSRRPSTGCILRAVSAASRRSSRRVGSCRRPSGTRSSARCSAGSPGSALDVARACRNRESCSHRSPAARRRPSSPPPSPMRAASAFSRRATVTPEAFADQIRQARALTAGARREPLLPARGGRARGGDHRVCSRARTRGEPGSVSSSGSRGSTTTRTREAGRRPRCAPRGGLVHLRLPVARTTSRACRRPEPRSG